MGSVARTLVVQAIRAEGSKAARGGSPATARNRRNAFVEAVPNEML